MKRITLTMDQRCLICSICADVKVGAHIVRPAFPRSPVEFASHGAGARRRRARRLAGGRQG